MSEQIEETLESQQNPQINDLLMKPFSLGWTREVVMRVVTKNRAPNCDIYYFSPSKKRIRSFSELKTILADGLSPECFSFKREPLGLSADLETIRDAKVRRKKHEKVQVKAQSVEKNLKKAIKSNSLKQDGSDGSDGSEGSDSGIKKEEVEAKVEAQEGEIEKKGDDDESNMINKEAEEIKNDVEKNPETRSKRIRQNERVPKENNNFKSTNRIKRKGSKLEAPVKLQSVRQKKNNLKRMMNAKKAKQSKVVVSKKILKKIVLKLVKSPNQKLSKNRKKREIGLKNAKNKKLKIKKGRKPLKSNLAKAKNEAVKEADSNETDKKSATRDLKSIVKKNIGKYREMREKQKLGTAKGQVRGASKRTVSASVTRTRSEPISKNKPFYLKPLQKGWRRELVYRSNSARAGQKADVYYFHPNGKKLRSCREIAENLTHGLSIECFTFRKEPLGCGEPSEVIRNARFVQKN